MKLVANTEITKKAMSSVHKCTTYNFNTYLSILCVGSLKIGKISLYDSVCKNILILFYLLRLY